MKKRIISLLLCLSLTFGIAVPAMTPQADAFIGSLIMTGVKMTASIAKSCINVCKNQHEYDNAGQAVGALFKNAALDFMGMGDSGSGGSSGGSTTTTIINQVDLSVVESSLSDINKQLTDQAAAIYQLESTVNQGISDLSDQLSVISAKIDELQGQVSDSTQLLQYYTYLNTFFEFFNQYYEALSYYDREINLMLSSGKYTEEAQKNLFDRFYQLSDVEYTGTFHSAVDKLGRYLQGNYLTSSPGSVVDVLSQYYITYYTLLKEKDPKVKAASDTEDMIGYLYYAYVMGIYYEQAIAMYQTAGINATGSSYKTDFGTVLTQTSIDNTVETLWTTVQSTVGCILRDLIKNYLTSASMPVVYQLSEGEILNRNVSSELFNTDGSSGETFHVQLNDTLTLQDPVGALSNFGETGSGYFSKEFCEAFADLASYQSTADMKALDACTFQVGKDDFDDTQVIEAKLGSATVFCIPVSLHEDRTFFAGDGTEDFPYLIRGGSNKNSAEAQIGYVFNASTSSTDNSNSIYADCHFVLGQDVDMQGLIYKGFQSFSGSFDGNGFTLKNFQLSSNLSNDRFGKTTGLFGVLTGTVRNLNVEDGRFITEKVAEIYGYSQSGNKYAGIIAGLVEQGGKVEYCQVKNSIVRQTLATRENISKYDDRNLIAGGAVGCVGNKGTLDAVVVIDTEVRVKSELLKQTTPKEGLSGGLGQAYAGGLTGALAEGGEITRCSYNQTENFKPASDSTDFKLYAESNNYAVAGGLIGWSEAKSEAQTAYCWVVLADSPTVTGETYALDYGIGHRVNDDVFPLFVYKVWPFTPNDVFQSTISVQVIQDYYAKYGMEQELDLTPFLTTDTDILELHFRTAVDGLVTPPAKLNYAPGEYLDLTGSVVYQSVGRCKLDTPYRYFLPYTMTSLKPMFHVYDALQGSVTIGFYYLRSSISSDAAGGISTGTALTVQERPHFFTTKTIKAATCTESGTTRNTCLICGKQEEVTIEPLGHKPVITKHGHAATCTEDGLTDEASCIICGEVITEQTSIPSDGHHTENLTILEPSCVSGGVKQEKCTVCGEIVSLENLKPLGHTYQATVTAPTCETPGYTTHTCATCGDSYTDSYTAPTDHHYGDGVETKKPTCTEEGVMTYTCTCGKTHTEPIPTIDHDYAPNVTAPTCTEMGYTTHTCTQCGESYVDTYTVPSGHSWNAGEIVTSPTLIATGLLRQSCTTCGEKRETVIPALTSCDGGMDCPSRKFTDVAGIENWSHIGIDYVIRSCIFYGTSATEFSPNMPMTRAMLVAVLYRMDGNASVDGLSHPFKDVPEGCWYEDALVWAYNNGIVSGTSATTFAPNSNTTRQQIAAILYRYANFCGYDVSASTDLTSFPDHDAIADYALTPLAWANATGLIQGSLDGTESLLLPAHSATRAQLAAILMRFMKTFAK